MDLLEKTLLLVEDDALIGLATSMQLRNAGYSVVHVTSGEAALEQVRLGAPPPDLVLMDIDLGPGMDGTATARAILEECTLPVVFLSSHTEREYVERTEKITSYGYVVKNSGEMVLLRSILMAFRLFEAHRQLLAGEQHLATTLDSIGDGVIATDTSGRVTRMNPVAQSLTGWTLTEAHGRLLSEVFRIVDTGSRVVVPDPVDRVLQTGEVVELGNHTTLLARDGTEYQIADSAAPIRAPDGTLHGVVLVFRDVTEEYRAREALRQSEHFLESVFESVQDGISVLNPDLTIRHVNGVMKKWYHDEALVVGSKCYEIYHHRREPCQDCPTLRALRSGHVERSEVRGREGSSVEWMELFSHPMQNPETGTITGVVEFVRDITERRRAENTLRHRQDLLERTQQMARIGSWVLDIPANDLSWSDEVFRIFGLEPQEFPATYEAFLDSIHPEDRELVDDAYTDSVRNDRDSYEVAHRVVRPTGEIRHVVERCIHERDESGTIIRSVGMVQDITDRKRAEATLQESESR
jgi:PAS domain S-box-containing protein